MEPKVVAVVTVDQLEEQVPLYPPNQPYLLLNNQPDLPPNNPPNQPNPPPNQPPNPSLNQPNPMQEQNPPPQAPQLNWPYFKPEFSGKPEEDVVAHFLRTNDLWKLTTFQMMQRYRDSV